MFADPSVNHLVDERKSGHPTPTSEIERKLSAANERLVLAGLRPSGPAVATSSTRLHLSLLRDLQRVVDLDSEVSDGALQFAMAKEKLDGPEIPGPPVDQCRFGTPH